MDGALLGCSQCNRLYRTRYVRCPADGAPVLETDQDPLLNRVFGERYLVEELLGTGASGRVYRATDWQVGQVYALKVFYGEYAEDEQIRGRLVREISAASRLTHPNVVGLVEVTQDDDAGLFFVMELAQAGTLFDLLVRRGPLPADLVVRLACQIVLGLEHAHRQGIIHRDLKTTNVVIGGGGDHAVPKVTDFGSSISVDQPAEDRLTDQGHCIGTPGWMSPEQASGQSVDHRSDLFNLGLLMYELLAGTPPFDGTSAQRSRLVAWEPLPRIVDRFPAARVPFELEMLIGELVAKAREARPATARAVIVRLESMMGSGPAIHWSEVGPRLDRPPVERRASA